LQERKTNRLRDFIMVAGQLGVSHFMIFSRTDKGTNMRIARVPRGPTLTFKVEQYALSKDVLGLQRNPKSPGTEFLTSPLLVLNNFNQEGKQFKLMTTMFQNMFPSINVQTVSISSASYSYTSQHSDIMFL
jgi:ribosome biogenesis protein SSF1/2